MVLILAFLVCLTMLSTIALVGIFSSKWALDAQKHTAARTDCARQVSANNTQAFQSGLSSLVDDLFNKRYAAAAADDASLKALPNYAKTVERVCPKSIAGKSGSSLAPAIPTTSTTAHSTTTIGGAH